MTESTTRLQAKIGSGEPLLVVEVVPPKGGDAAPLRAAVQRYAGKVDAIGVSDNRHGVCMAALAAAGIVAAEGVEPILHMVTRDRNRIALLANCLGAQALGVRNILCTSGTHQTLGICPPAKNVFDIDSIQLLDAIAHVGTDGSAVYPERFEGAGPFCLGAVAAPFADPPELQLIRLAKKVSAGANFVITQPVYDIEPFRAWWEQVAQRGIHERVAVLACIEPLLDAGQATVFAASRPSPLVPEAALDRLSSAGDQAAQRAAGIEIALETIEQLSALTGLRGFQICADGHENA
ncbi:MAG: methylenetetrahydrofolate reductase, partial [Candidatus Hydrogenedentes bacterium]|nr:methylenetetrahydrofolate reductase [Candidatus Hydrogenedentota bacterium]